MSKNKKHRSEATVNIVIPNNASAKEISHIIADGLMEFEERKQQQEKEAKRLRHEEWQRALGVKDFSNVKRPLKWWLQFWNRAKVAFKVCIIPGKHIKGDGATFSVMQMILAMFFGVLNWLLLLSSVFLFLCVPILLASNSLPIPGWTVANCLSFGVYAFIFSRVFRIVTFEIMNIEDRNYLFGVFTCVASIVSAVAAVTALLVSQG